MKIILSVCTIFFFVIVLFFSGSSDLMDTINKEQNDSEKVSIRLIKDLEIGDSNNGLIFGSLGLYLDVNTSGEIFVADVQSRKLRKFSNKGQLLQLIGKTGRGPGEFLHLTDFKLNKNDQPVVLDFTLKRISVFDASNYDSTTTILIDNSVPGHIISEVYPLDQSNKSFLLGFTPSYSNTAKIVPENNLYFSFTGKGSLSRDTILVVPAEEIGLNRNGGNTSIRVLQFGRKSITHVGSDKNIYSGWNNQLNINVYSPDGVKIQSIQREINKVAISDSDINKNFGEATHDYFPTFDWFVVDNQSRVWVAVNIEDRQNYSLRVYDQKGNFIDKTPLPKSVELKVIKNGLAYGIKEGKNGTKSVVRFKIKDIY